MYVPSMSAVSAPRSGSNTAIAAWWVGSSVPAFPSKSVTSFVSSRFADGRYAGITPSSPCPEKAATRCGIDARPPLRSTNASASASTSASRSSSASTSLRDSTNTYDTRFSQESACWFHGTRCVTPAACIRARFATYQS